MDLHRLGQLAENVGGVKPSVSPSVGKGPGKALGPDFAETLRQVTETPKAGIQSTDVAKQLVFSKHAVERMQTRGIGMTPDRMQKLESAFTKAADKGSKNTLVLMDDSAFIMSVKNKTIVTVMDKMNMKENLFTNIDSTIMV